MRVAVRALSYRNYRLFFAGQSLSLIGTIMSQIAVSWLMYRLTGSALYLGLTAFAGQIPILLLSSFTGVWSDRVDRRRIMLATQCAAMALAFVLAWLSYSGQVRAWHLLAASVLLGVINAFDAPARHALAAQLVPSRQDLPNAVALNSFMMNAAKLLGPAVAGPVIVFSGEALCFLINAFSYAAVIAALARMEIPRAGNKADGGHLENFLEGLDYAFRSEAIRTLLLLLASVTFLAAPYSAFLPVFAREVYHGDANTLALLSAAAGLGALAGTLYLASRTNISRLPGVVAHGACALGFALMLFSLCRVLWLGVGFMLLTGLSFILFASASNMVLQSVVHEDKRGRVMGLYVVAFLGFAPLGSLISGFVAEHAGVPATIFGCGLLSALAALFALRRMRAGIPPAHAPA